MLNVRLAAYRTAPRQLRRSARDVVEGYFDFDTTHGLGTGFVRLLVPPDGAPPKVWLLLTTLQQLAGHEEMTGSRRPTGVNYSTTFAGDNWLDERVTERKFEDRDPEVVIVGGGQGGLIIAARLRQMGVDALVVEKRACVGDNWRHRYHSLTLHNEVWVNSLPYMPFPETWPTFVPKDKLAGWLEAYAEAMELNVWTSTEMRTAEYDEDSATWTITLSGPDGANRTVNPRHLVMAVGGCTGVPNIPDLPGLPDFRGDVVHSSRFTSGMSYAGRHAVVVGTGTSGHDVAQDLYENGAASVTMIQRGPTCVVSPHAEGPYRLFGQAVGWLRRNRVLLPGVSVLARLVASVRDGAADRMHRVLADAAAAAGPALPSRLGGLLVVPDGQRFSELERLRQAPRRTPGKAMTGALDRVSAVLALGARSASVEGVPANGLAALARYGLAAKAPALRDLAESRKTATLLAAARHLEAAAVDDALDLFDDLHDRAAQAARACAVADLATFRTAAVRTSPLDVLQPPGEAGDWDEQRLAPPSETGIHAIDAEAKKPHAEAVGAPLPRRGPAPKRRSRYAALAAPSPEPPGSKLAAVADFLRGHTSDGALMRRLHPTEPKD